VVHRVHAELGRPRSFLGYALNHAAGELENYQRELRGEGRTRYYFNSLFTTDPATLPLAF